jgi:flagellar basal body P-ring formation protein FlgA
MRYFLALLLILMPIGALAETVVAARTIRAQTILTAQDLVVKPQQIVGTFDDPVMLIGMEARVALYAGRPIRQGDIGPPAIIDRNQVVMLIYMAGGLLISTEARALARGGVGDRVRVLNMSSRLTVEGLVLPDGRVRVQ